MRNTITSAELLPMLEGARAYVSDCSVGFIRAYQFREARCPGPEDFVADVGGSGTLVRIGDVKAILTADHVIEKLREGKGFGLVMLTRFPGRHYRMVVESAERIVTVGRGPEPSKGPDLALLVLSPVDTAKPEVVGKFFYNLSVRNRMLDQLPEPDARTALVLCGMVGEWTKDVPPPPGFQGAKHFRGLYGPVVFDSLRNDGDFDYLSVEVRRDGSYTGPKSFQGCSGGSLWRIALSKGNGESVIAGDPVLYGVPFYERSEGERTIIECHGWKSIYSAAVEALK